MTDGPWALVVDPDDQRRAKTVIVLEGAGFGGRVVGATTDEATTRAKERRYRITIVNVAVAGDAPAFVRLLRSVGEVGTVIATAPNPGRMLMREWWALTDDAGVYQVCSEKDVRDLVAEARSILGK